ncbi:MAG: hypothetical protein K9N34_07195 [Candidatus Marinimicrobia bacterium]|nr:hypothetical protein [Candidatus Neomarinimicrobiota bacterium]MCF7840437.1 hypothetical protein [Candidatus Neomarinimicrobiota bacterium]MCF7903033.1 hypothetical protein [Candidatus Neomarinimicrobiota bacterium]
MAVEIMNEIRRLYIDKASSIIGFGIAKDFRESRFGCQGNFKIITIIFFHMNPVNAIIRFNPELRDPGHYLH